MAETGTVRQDMAAQPSATPRNSTSVHDDATPDLSVNTKVTVMSVASATMGTLRRSGVPHSTKKCDRASTATTAP